MEYRPYKLLNRTELAAIERQLDSACGAWSLEWLSGALPGPVQCRPSADYRADPSSITDSWMIAAADPAQWVAVRFAAALSTHLGKSLVPGGQGGAAPVRASALLDELAMRALADLLHPVCPWMAGRSLDKMAPGAPLPAHAWETGSGAVVAELAWGEARLEIVLSGAQVLSMLGDTPGKAGAGVPFAKTTDALLNQRLQLAVWAGEVQLELGLLQTIVVGDVIKLNTRIDEPLQVLTMDGSRVCNAFLGSYEGRKSIKLVASSLTKV